MSRETNVNSAPTQPANFPTTPTYTTRPPSGGTPWPIMLIAGTDGGRPEREAAAAALSENIGRTLWITVGEDQPDEYPQGSFDIVEHDGTYLSILGAVQWAVDQPTDHDLPNLIVLHSATRLWSMLTDAAQATTYERIAARNLDPDVEIARDLWHEAKARHNAVIAALRRHHGPVILTAGLEGLIVHDDGQPTGTRIWRPVTEKNLPDAVSCVIHMRGYDDLTLAATKFPHLHPGVQLPRAAAVEWLWDNMGLPDTAGLRHHATTRPLGAEAEAAHIADLLEQAQEAANRAGVPLAAVSEAWARDHDGEWIRNATDVAGLTAVRDHLMQLATEATAAAVDEQTADTEGNPAA